MDVFRSSIVSFAKASSVLALIFNLVGCTRAEKTSKLTIDVPMSTKNIALNTLELQHLVINVSGGGIPAVILYTWSACRDCAGPQPVPEHVIEVPSGSGRLIQVLALYSNTSSNLSKFYYGDQSADLAGGDVSVNIPVLSLTGEIPLASGSINGRWIDGQDGNGADFGPSGSIDIRYQPEGKPAMLVERSGILDGWFTAFGLANIPLRYVISESNRDLFGQAVELYGTSGIALSDRVAKFSIPAHTRVYTSGGSTLIDSNELEPTFNILGFFGAGVRSAHKVCADLNGLSQSSKTRLNNVGTFLNFAELSVGAAFPSVAMMAAGSISTMHWQGGIPHASCGSDAVKATQMYKDFLSLRIDNFENGKEGAGGFYYPFGRIEFPGGPVTAGSLAYAWADGNPLLTDLGSTGVKVAAALLPGGRSVLDRVDFFKVNDVEAALNAGDHYAPCTAIVAGGFGSTFLGSANLTANGQFMFEGTGFSSVDTDANRGLAMCFNRIGLGLAARGALLEPWIFSNSNNSNNGPYLRVQLYGAMSAGDEYRVIPQTCYAAEIKNYIPPTPPGTQSPDAPNTTGSPWNLSISSNGGWAQFSTTPGCAAPSGSLSVSIANTMATSGTFYIRANSPNLDREFMISGVPPETSYSPSYNRVDVDQPQLALSLAGTLGTNLCYPLRIERRDSLGSPLSTPNILNFTVDNGSGIPETIYPTMNDCVTMAAGVSDSNIPVSFSEKTFYYRAGASGTIRFQDSGSVYSSAQLNFTVDSLATNRPGKVVLQFQGTPPNPLEVGVCYNAVAKVVNDLGVEVATVSSIDVEIGLSSDDRLLIHPSGCYSSYSSERKVTINSGESRKMFGFRVTGPSSSSSLDIKQAQLPFDASSSAPISSIAAPTTRPALSFDLPANWYNKKIGTHEFRNSGNFRVINYVIPTGASLGFSCPSCSAGSNASGGILNWHSTDALNGHNLQFTVGLNGMIESFNLDPANFFGPEFRVISCGISLGGSVNNLVTTVGNTALVSNTDATPHITTGQTICINASSTFESTGGFVLQEDAKIIGWSDKTSTLRKTSPGGAVLGTGSFGGVAANLRLEFSFPPNSSSSSKAFALMNPTGTSTNATELNSVFMTMANESATGFFADGIYIEGNMTRNVLIRDAIVVLGTLGTMPGAAIKSVSSSMIDVKDLALRSSHEKNSVLDASNVASAATNSIFVNGVTMRSQNGATNGLGRLLWGSGGSDGTNNLNISFTNAAMILDGTAAMNSGMVRVMPNTNLSLERSYLVSSGMQPLIYIMDGTANLTARDNVLVQLGNYPMISIIPGGSDVVKSWMFGGNQLIRPSTAEGYTAVGGAGYSMIQAAGMSLQQTLTPPGGYGGLPNYGNSICLNDAYASGTSFANSSSGTWGGTLAPSMITPVIGAVPLVGGRPYCR